MKKLYVFSLAVVFLSSSNTIIAQNPVNEEVKVIEHPPVYPGCEHFEGDSKMLRNCMSIKISAFVTMKIKTRVMRNLIHGKTYKIYVNFTIDEEGEVTDVSAKGPTPEMEKEAVRVVKKLPDMKPGIMDGEPVRVKYSLPIHIKVPRLE